MTARHTAVALVSLVLACVLQASTSAKDERTSKAKLQERSLRLRGYIKEHGALSRVLSELEMRTKRMELHGGVGAEDQDRLVELARDAKRLGARLQREAKALGIDGSEDGDQAHRNAIREALLVQKALYGPDNREDIYVTRARLATARRRMEPAAYLDAVVRNSHSVVAITKASHLVPVDTQEPDSLPGNVRAEPEQFWQVQAHQSRWPTRKWCPSERFRSQLQGVCCSGFVIAPDLIATARHCLQLCARGADIRVVLDWEASATKGTERFVRRSNVLAATVSKQGTGGTHVDDWLLLKTSRQLPAGVTPLKLGDSSASKLDDAVYVIGHPAGQPKKYAGGANILNVAPSNCANSTKTCFLASLDVYIGSSGAPVFNRAHEVIGMVVAGRADYEMVFVPDPSGCYRSLQYRPSGSVGELALRVEVLRQHLQ